MATELIVVVAALRRELMHLWGRLSGVSRIREAPCSAWRGRLGDRELLLVVSGMGKKAATRAVEWVLGKRPSRVLNVGFAGACRAAHMGELILPGEVCDESGQILRLKGSGRLLTLAGVAGPAEERKHDADAVDRETFHVVQRCQAARVPVTCVRAISDTPDHPISPHLASVLDGEQVRLGALAWAVLRRPWLLSELRRLARDSDLAARSLAAGIVQALTH